MLSLDHACRIIDAALADARRRDVRPLAIVVLDGGGHPIAFKREDGATLFRYDIARAKAMGALGMGIDTREIAARAASNPTFYSSVVVASGGNLALSPGGLLIRDIGGLVVGAVGISGDTGDADEECAAAGIVAAGFKHGGSS